MVIFNHSTAFCFNPDTFLYFKIQIKLELGVFPLLLVSLHYNTEHAIIYLEYWNNNAHNAILQNATEENVTLCDELLVRQKCIIVEVLL